MKNKMSNRKRKSWNIIVGSQSCGKNCEKEEKLPKRQKKDEKKSWERRRIMGKRQRKWKIWSARGKRL